MFVCLGELSVCVPKEDGEVEVVLASVKPATHGFRERMAVALAGARCPTPSACRLKLRARRCAGATIGWLARFLAGSVRHLRWKHMRVRKAH